LEGKVQTRARSRCTSGRRHDCGKHAAAQTAAPNGK